MHTLSCRHRSVHDWLSAATNHCGVSVGKELGLEVGCVDGLLLGLVVGSTDGLALGDEVGSDVGLLLGLVVGSADGDVVGWDVGSTPTHGHRRRQLELVAALQRTFWPATTE